MTIETKVCDRCKQSAFIDLFHHWKDQQVCADCFQRLSDDLYSWDNNNIAIKLEIGSDCYDYETIYLPFIDNAEQINDIDPDIHTVKEAVKILKAEWEGSKWGYYGNVSDIELVDIRDIEPKINPLETITCSEFDIYIYKDLAFEYDLYDCPFDYSPNDMIFSCDYAIRCMIGEIYSKDFMYEYCEGCGRYVCAQDPANGWHSQVHYGDGFVECNKCYEERTLAEGINDDFNNNIPGQFYNDLDIKSNGWLLYEGRLLAGSGRVGYSNPNNVIDKISALIDKDTKVLINYEDMAIGGLGGYVSIYTK